MERLADIFLSNLSLDELKTVYIALSALEMVSILSFTLPSMIIITFWKSLSHNEKISDPGTWSRWNWHIILGVYYTMNFVPILIMGFEVFELAKLIETKLFDNGMFSLVVVSRIMFMSVPFVVSMIIWKCLQAKQEKKVIDELPE